ncbi:hypothetical protein [Sphingomonas sp. MMS24-J13]|uniref:hypothetical protein n=1 Tax=Sphingomonas sp. MMS24-J13 TaxID=3238686 RepID=UPI00384FDA5C
MSFVTLPEDHLRGGLAQAGLPTRSVNAVIAIQKRFLAGAFVPAAASEHMNWLR